MIRTIVLWVFAACVLLVVFALYQQPYFVFTVANQVWGCF